MQRNEPGKSPGKRGSNSPGIGGNGSLISYNEDERPGGLRIRFKIRVESGKKSAALMASAVKELSVHSPKSIRRGQRGAE
jgi:hypothetical protein